MRKWRGRKRMNGVMDMAHRRWRRRIRRRRSLLALTALRAARSMAKMADKTVRNSSQSGNVGDAVGRITGGGGSAASVETRRRSESAVAAEKKRRRSRAAAEKESRVRGENPRCATLFRQPVGWTPFQLVWHLRVQPILALVLYGPTPTPPFAIYSP